MASHPPKSPAKKNFPLTAALESFRVARERQGAERPRHLMARALQDSALLHSELALPPTAFQMVSLSPQLGQYIGHVWHHNSRLTQLD